jgi:tRNA dimethylallyltransferase
MVEAPQSEFPVPSGESVPLVAILGPTASGKSALAVRIARQFEGEVIACDSTQVYRGFDIGTAKPTPAEQSGIPHHMTDLVEPGELFTAGEYRRRALVLLGDLRRRGRLPVFTAGTGLYLRALLEGLADAPERSERLRARLDGSVKRRGHAHLHRLLRRLDPAAAARISPNDTQKLIRALEVCLIAGRPLTEIHRAGREPLQGHVPIKIGLHPPRGALHERIARRMQEMLERGWLAEIAALIARGTPVSAKPFEFIGYRELRAHLVGEKSLEEAAQAITLATRQYAKRQMTWFRRESGVAWFAGFGDEPHLVAAALALLDERLRRSLQKTARRPEACPDRV